MTIGVAIYIRQTLTSRARSVRHMCGLQALRLSAEVKVECSGRLTGVFSSSVEWGACMKLADTTKCELHLVLFLVLVATLFHCQLPDACVYGALEFSMGIFQESLSQVGFFTAARKIGKPLMLLPNTTQGRQQPL